MTYMFKTNLIINKSTQELLYSSYYQSPLGDILLLSTANALCGLYFKNQKYFMEKIEQKLVQEKELNIHTTIKHYLDLYFSPQIKNTPSKPLPLNLYINLQHTTKFQLQIYQLLLLIPYGTTTTYKDIALQFTHPNKAHHYCQAVASAIAHNPIAIFIPCHRVIGSNGKLTGYAAGVDKKQQLLKIEQKHQLPR